MSIHNRNPLEYFMPGRVRGNDFETKLESFLITVRKVIEDSTEDVSSYRRDYSSTHQSLLIAIEVSDNIRDVLQNFVDSSLSMMDEVMSLSHPGMYDALGRLSAEAVDILSVEQKDV